MRAALKLKAFKLLNFPSLSRDYRSMEADGEHLQVQWELADVSLMPLLIVLEMLSSGDLLEHWEKANVTPVFKEQEEGPWEQQASQPHLSPWEDDRVNTAGNHFKAH